MGEMILALYRDTKQNPTESLSTVSNFLVNYRGREDNVIDEMIDERKRTRAANIEASAKIARAEALLKLAETLTDPPTWKQISTSVNGSIPDDPPALPETKA